MAKEAREEELVEQNNAKRYKSDHPQEVEEGNDDISAIERIQQELHALDELCAKEQMMIQKKFDERKKPLFDKRQLHIEKIPNFWADALSHHPGAGSFCAEDQPLLEHLKRIELEDNLDENGSYRIRFVFTDEIKEYFTPTTLEKHVVFDDNQEEHVECTDIVWKPGKEPALSLKKNSLEDDADGGIPEWSIFEWFVKSIPLDKPDIGEVIRRELWHAPLGYYMKEQSYDEIEDDVDLDYEDIDDDDAVDEEGAEEVEEVEEGSGESE